MRVDAETPAGLWETERLTLPPRSRLHHLEPVGIGTPDVESLTGYTARLAEAHRISTAVLFGHELAPLACKEYLRRAALRSKYPCRILANAFRPLARAMNGTGLGASEWMHILQALTLRTDLRFLTLLTWKEVLPQSQLLRPERAWCPACYEEWRDRRSVIYEPLLWTLKAITVCQRHGEPLRTFCNHCKKSLHPLASRSRPGYCSACGMWLGEATNIKQPSNGRQAVKEMDRQMWAAYAVGELLTKAPSLVPPPTRGGILKSSSEYIKGHVGNLPALAKSLGVNKTTLWQWSKGKHLLQLESLLKLCYQLEVPLLDFVTGKIIRKYPMNITAIAPEDVEEVRPPARSRKALDREEAHRILQFAVEEMPPPSLQDVAARLGRDGNTLRYWFGDLCKAIVERYATYQKVCYTKRWEDIENALLEALNEAEPPSMAQVAARLGYDSKSLTKHYPELCQKISVRHAGSRRSRWEEIRVTLQVTLTEQPPPSVLKVARRLGLSKSSLYKHLPGLCHQIAGRYVTNCSRHRMAGLNLERG